MDTHCDNKLSLNLPSYTQLICQYDFERSALWYYLNPRPRPCFTPTLLEEIRDLQQRVADHLRVSPDDLHYFIMASATPKVFSLGGDLELFVRLITERDRDRLYEYGRICVDADAAILIKAVAVPLGDEAHEQLKIAAQAEDLRRGRGHNEVVQIIRRHAQVIGHALL